MQRWFLFLGALKEFGSSFVRRGNQDNPTNLGPSVHRFILSVGLTSMPQRIVSLRMPRLNISSNLYGHMIGPRDFFKQDSIGWFLPSAWSKLKSPTVVDMLKSAIPDDVSFTLDQTYTVLSHLHIPFTYFYILFRKKLVLKLSLKLKWRKLFTC